MPALSTSYLRRKVAQKQLSENKKQKGIPNDYLAYPFTVVALSRGEVLGLMAKQKPKKQKQKLKGVPKRLPYAHPVRVHRYDFQANAVGEGPRKGGKNKFAIVLLSFRNQN
jgi:hypothetical protein